ncbi:MAG TPA: hypothetical protein VNP04_15025 [Alphaproteobacteria bacterium]|nr:hypothetical protein [Alphaproteobacteria bacterium]
MISATTSRVAMHTAPHINARFVAKSTGISPTPRPLGPKPSRSI